MDALRLSTRRFLRQASNRIEFLVAMPISIRPIIDGIDKASRAMNSARKAPGTESTSAARMVSGSTKSLNSSTRTTLSRRYCPIWNRGRVAAAKIYITGVKPKGGYGIPPLEPGVPPR